jgi:hypothetical protein
MEKEKISNYGELLQYALGKKLLKYEEFGSYQGDYIAILQGDNEGIEIWKGSYGSCSGCDWLEAERDWEDGTISKEKALEYVKDDKPFLIVEKNKIPVLVNSENISAFFPANTRKDYNDWIWEDIKKILREL